MNQGTILGLVLKCTAKVIILFALPIHLRL